MSDQPLDLGRRLAAEAIGTAFLLATVVGSGIMGETLAGGQYRDRTAREHHPDRCDPRGPDHDVRADLWRPFQPSRYPLLPGPKENQRKRRHCLYCHPGRCSDPWRLGRTSDVRRTGAYGV